jgi:hypothetical protein
LTIEISEREAEALKYWFTQYFKTEEDPIMFGYDDEANQMDIAFSQVLARIGVKGMILPDGSVS